MQPETPSHVVLPSRVDDDPVGSLRLEGQVVYQDNTPASGAVVFIGSSPPKSTTSEEDGSFFFEQLVGRRYTLSARTTNHVGGPISIQLSTKTEPVILHLQEGGGIDVEIFDEQSIPIAGATVTIGSFDLSPIQTNAEGVASIRNLPPGRLIVSASAAGYATSTSLAMVPSSAEQQGLLRLTLVRGTTVKGTIVDSEDKPVANAKVIARAVGAFLHLQDPRKVGVSSDAQGNFVLPAVPVGSMQLFAIHDDYAPSTSERFSVGESEVTGIKLIMRDGASIAGQVQTQNGEPVPWATVRVISLGGNRGSKLDRQHITKKDGSFEIKGLPQEQMVVSGNSETASSEGITIDLRVKARVADLNIVLTVEGEIRGSVVDEHGEPISEAQVQAYPNIWEGADFDQLRVRGTATATTSAEGEFTIRGLPEGQYRISASLGVPERDKAATQAKTGDQGIVVVLASPGRIRGKVLFDDGEPPDLAIVSVAYDPGIPTSTGRFELRDVRPGSYEVAIRGPNFPDTFVPNVEVLPDKTVDIGTVSVTRGRTVRGQVLDSSGTPVPDAEVVLGRQLVSDGSSLIPQDVGTSMGQRNATRRAITDQNGEYVLHGIGTQEWTIAADQRTAGRSIAQVLASGHQSVKMDLELRPVGSIHGVVSVNGEPTQGVQVVMSSTESTAQHMVVVYSNERGQFFVDRVTIGQQKVSAIMGADGSNSMAATSVVVKAGEDSKIMLNIEEGSVTLTAEIDTAIVDVAQMFLFKGIVNVTNGGELNELYLASATDVKMSWAVGDSAAAFKKVVHGEFSLCVTPINGDMDDPAFKEKLQRHASQIDVYCEPLTISKEPLRQNHKVVVPPMKPLAED